MTVLRPRELLLEELRDALVAAGEPRYRAEQLFRWTHQKGATSLAEMTDVGRAARERLAAAVDLTPLQVDLSQTAHDGTTKLRLVTADGRKVESVLIPERDPGRVPLTSREECWQAKPASTHATPDDDKLTLCISSQVGCAIGCKFCATATLGLMRNLTAGEIVDQVYRARAIAGRRISHLVFMGMGEPMHNYDGVLRAIRLLCDDLGLGFSTRRITVSTSGLVPGIERLGREPFQVNLAVSLNATTDEVRTRLMPINKKYPLATLLGAIRAYPLARRRRVTFEYVLLAGVNDTDADARRLVKLLHGIPAKVNLIPWNPHPTLPFARPAREHVLHFQAELKRHGIGAYLRETRGDDIAAACGQLVAQAPPAA
ncbi:MAG TPA: 23S rRNA (adenine(2503)-C(2))-methyltransferase RlmN [Polyangia bacterium]|jgi:23S rRNA (adenine2503-C2)-methyltransferase